MAQAKVNRKQEKKMKENILMLDDERRHADQYKEQAEKVRFQSTLLDLPLYCCVSGPMIWLNTCRFRLTDVLKPSNANLTNWRRKFRVKRPRGARSRESSKTWSPTTNPRSGKSPTSKTNSGTRVLILRTHTKEVVCWAIQTIVSLQLKLELAHYP